MSKLTDLIERMGRQSPQPIGFGALSGTAAASRTMALVARTNAAGAARALADAGGISPDAVLVDFADDSGERVTGTEAMNRLGVKTGVVSRLCREGKLDGEKRGQTWMVSVESLNRYALSGVGEALDGTLWGASVSRLSGAEVDALAEAGCDFFVIGEDGAPGAVVSHVNAAKLLALSEPVDRETSAALRGLGVAGAVTESGVDADSGEIGFADLVALRRIGASAGGIMLAETSGSASAKDLAILRDAGADGVIAPLSDADSLANLERAIAELPPKRRPDARGLQAAVGVSAGGG